MNHRKKDKGQLINLEGVFYMMPFGRVISESPPSLYDYYGEDEAIEDLNFLVQALYNQQLDVEIDEAWERNKSDLDTVELIDFYNALFEFLYKWFGNLDKISKGGCQIYQVDFYHMDGLFHFHREIMKNVNEDIDQMKEVSKIRNDWGNSWLE